MVYLMAVGISGYGNDVESHGHIQFEGLQVGFGRCHDVAYLAVVHGFIGLAIGVVAARFHLDNGQCAVFLGHDKAVKALYCHMTGDMHDTIAASGQYSATCGNSAI